MSGVIRVALVDDEPLFTAGPPMLLGAQPNMEVFWQAGDGCRPWSGPARRCRPGLSPGT